MGHCAPPGFAPYPFAYVSASTVPFLPPFSGVQPQPDFPPQGSLHPPPDWPACLQTMPTSAAAASLPAPDPAPNRVILQSGKDDYINTSRIKDLSCYCPTIIATQALLVGAASDFWLMMYEQKVSLVVMLVSEQEMVGCHWPWLCSEASGLLDSLVIRTKFWQHRDRLMIRRTLGPL